MKADLDYALQIIIVTGSAAIAVNMIYWAMGYYWFPKREKERALSFTVVALAFCLFLVAPLLIVPTLAALWFTATEGTLPLPLSPYIEGWLHLISTLLTFCIFSFYTFLLGKQEREALFGKLERPVKSVALGVASWFVVYPAMLFLGNLLSTLLFFLFDVELVEQVAVEKIKLSSNYPLQEKLITLSVVTLVPFLEELLFRGYLQAFLRQHMSRLAALITASLLFSLFHFSPKQGISNVQIIPTIFLLSCYMGFLREREKTILAPMALHSFFNGMSLFFLKLQ